MRVPQQADFYTVAEVAELLRLSELTVYRAIQGGSLPAVRLSKRGALRVPARELARLLETRPPRQRGTAAERRPGAVAGALLAVATAPTPSTERRTKRAIR